MTELTDSSVVKLLLMLSRFSCVRLFATQRRQPTRLPHPWDSPGKNTGVGCHFLLQCMKVKSESEVAQLCRLLVIPRTAAYQAPPSMGFSRQEYWSGVPLPSPKPGRSLGDQLFCRQEAGDMEGPLCLEGLCRILLCSMRYINLTQWISIQTNKLHASMHVRVK